MRLFNHEARAQCARAESIFIFLTAKGAGVGSQGAKIKTQFDSTGAQASGRK